jgi:acyl-CoA synthetase (AMP-forming)/AMP-acid ligase II
LGILRANAVVVPVNPMNRAEELKHFITDPDARVAITTADLAAEWARASDALARGRRLAHLIVTHFTDAFDPACRGRMRRPRPGTAWLTTRHALPPLAGGAGADLERGAGRADLPRRRTRRPAGSGLLPYTSGTTGLPKGCMHPHATLMHQAVAASLLGPGLGRECVAGRGADVPRHRHDQCHAQRHLRAPRWSSCRAGTATGRAHDRALARHPLDQHPHHGDRPAGQPALERSTCPRWC